jgi:hypothetical protein
MEIIKECVEIRPGAVRCIVRATTGADSEQHITALFNSAAADFPALKRSDVEVVRYGGRAYPGTFGIEFTAPQKPPAAYARTNRLEPTL